MLLASVVVTYAQNTVRGVVISATDQEPIIGATVLEKGSLNGTVTDLDGQFTSRRGANEFKSILPANEGCHWSAGRR